MPLLLPNPHSKQAEFLADPHRFKVLNWGRRSGKSVGVWEKVVLEGMLRQGTYYIIAPTYKQAKSIYWREICKKYRAEFMTFNEQELSITFDILTDVEIETQEGPIKINHDPNLPATRIELKGADNPESLRGVGLCGAVLDEYAFMPDGKYVYDTIIRPALADKNGWSVFISTPNGVYNHFYDLVQEAQRNPERYYYSHATALDNKYFMEQSPTEFEDTRKEFEAEGKIDIFNQEWMAEFVNPSQLIYSEFDIETHVFHKFSDMPDAGTYCLTIDFGSTDPTAALCILIDYEGNWWIFDELYQTDLNLDQLVYALTDKMGDYHFARIIGDSQAKFALQSLRKRSFRITGSKKGADSINNGIKEVQALLKVRESTGKPKLFIHARCKNTIREFQIYSWLRDAFGEISQTAEDKNNHAMDALRYLALDKARAVKRTKRKRDYDPITGRVLN
jgi:phage terminase large subunit